MPKGEVDRDPSSVVLVLATSTGGVGRHVAAVAAGLATQGRRVAVAAPPQTDAAFRFGPVADFVALDIANRPRPWRDAQAAWRLRKLARDSDVLHAHGIRAGAVAAASLLGRRDRRPVLVVSWHNAVLGSARRVRLARLLERQVARRADLVLAVSADLTQHLQALSNTRVSRDVVAAPTRHAVRTAAEVRAELGVAEPGRLVLAVGRLHAQKGFDVLVAASSLLPADVLVAIAGEGPVRAALEQAVNATGVGVRLLGHRDDVADLLGAADVVVMPSRWEGWPLAAAEVLASGRPLVATAVGGLPELVGDAALLVPPDDPAALASAISQVLDDAATASSLSAAACRRSAQLPTEADVTTAALKSYRLARSERAKRRQQSRAVP
jgi:glycosyltransferase involved in cell wall biosynthesis